MAIDELNNVVSRFGRSVSEDLAKNLIRSIINQMSELTTEGYFSDYDFIIVPTRYESILVVFAVADGYVFHEVFTIQRVVVRFKK